MNGRILKVKGGDLLKSCVMKFVFEFVVEKVDSCNAGEGSRAENGVARAGVIVTPHARLETPYFQPVATAGAIKGVTWSGMRELGYPHVLMNTYHLVLRPGVERLRECGGMRAFSGWDGGILTDSGGYQVFSLAKLRKIMDDGVSFMSHIDGSMHRLTPESVVDAQLTFGSDIAMPLDVCSAHDADFGAAERELAVTAKWLREAAEVWHGRGGSGTGTELFGIVQGALYEELRERAARDAAMLELPGYAVGGLSVGESDADFVRLAKHCARLLPENKPRYLMGVGRPADIIRAIGWGYDLFDCVLPTRMARHNVAYTRFGQLDLRKAQFAMDDTPLDSGCACSVCSRYTRSYIYHLAKLHEMNAPILLTTHNLHFYREIVAAARAAILGRDYLAFAYAWLTRMGEWHDEWDG